MYTCIVLHEIITGDNRPIITGDNRASAEIAAILQAQVRMQSAV